VFPVSYELNSYILFREKLHPLWSSGQSSWLQIQSPGSIPGATRFPEE
jgi:hypothetical protein